MKKISIILLSSALLFAQTTFAARLGGQRSMGMQRNTPTQSYSNSNRAAPAAPSQQQAQRSGPGMGGVVAGAAAGAVGGYLLGKSMNSERSNSSQSASSSSANESNIPWGIIAILGMLLVIGLMIFRRKAAATNQGNFGGVASNNNSFSIPNIRRDNTSFGQSSTQNSASGAYNDPSMERMADGVEAQYFLRQAKGMFLHIQSMNTLENVTEVQKYMTPDLYNEIKQSITANDYIADFSQLDCQLLQSATENTSFVASVRFFGKVSDAPNMPAVDFNEIWNFVKPTGNESAKWLVAGIQQVSVN